MENEITRRDFLELAAAGCALCLGGIGCPTSTASTWRKGPRLVSPGCRGTKVKVARLYMGKPDNPYWPKPHLDLKKEIRFYESEFAKLRGELADVDFVVDELVASADEVSRLGGRLKGVDGILVIHLTMGTGGVLREALKSQKPTMVFAVPYSGHQWTHFGELRKQELGAKLECILTSDYKQLAAAVRPFRAIHHLREAKILDVKSPWSEGRREYAERIRNKFGTEIKRIELERVVNAYKGVDDKHAKAEADRWIKGAVRVVEPSREDIFRSCRLALAFERLLDEENATVMTVDCYGSMFKPLCREYAFPCIGFTRLNNMGLGGICESNLPDAMAHILFQGLVGRPGFISDPTIDESNNTAILAHCLGTTKMDGPDGPAAPYKLRTIMERREGAVAQVQMRVGQKVTQVRLSDTDLLLYFTGEIIGTPVSVKADRGCRTKIAVRVDGDARKLWQNWSHGLHRQTCYGDITKELEHFCRFKDIRMVNEAV
ncbi:MAG: twin-arginine translocation signal domain-containing protein [Planctomycetota bacterium]